MPVIDLTTNTKPADVKAFIREFSKFSAQVLGKPEECIMIKFQVNEDLYFNGSFDSAFALHVSSMDNINPENNIKFSRSYFDFLEQKLGLPNNRGFIEFVDPGRENLAWSGTTFAELWK